MSGQERAPAFQRTAAFSQAIVSRLVEIRELGGTAIVAAAAGFAGTSATSSPPSEP